MVKGVIFDFDGVIVESEPLFLDSIILYLRKFNIETDYKKIVEGGFIEKFCLSKQEQKKLQLLRKQNNVNKLFIFNFFIIDWLRSFISR